MGFIIRLAVSLILFTSVCIGLSINKKGNVDYPAKCKAPRCVDYVMENDECCPTCPTGKNCYLEGKIVSASAYSIIHDDGYCRTICRCPGQEGYDYSGRDTNAECTDHCQRNIEQPGERSNVLERIQEILEAAKQEEGDM